MLYGVFWGVIGEISGLKMSRIFGGYGITKYDLGFCCEIYVIKDVIKYYSEVSLRKEDFFMLKGRR